MTFKKTSFNESEIMREYARVALDQKIITLEPVKKTASEVISLKPTDNLTQNIMTLCAALRSAGNIAQAKELECNFINYKSAETHLYNVTNETGEDLIDQAHPDGSPKVTDDKESVVETESDIHDAVVKMLAQKPIGKHAQTTAKVSPRIESIIKDFLHFYNATIILINNPAEANKHGANSFINWGELESYGNTQYTVESLHYFFSLVSEKMDPLNDELKKCKDKFLKTIVFTDSDSLAESEKIINTIIKDIIGVWYTNMMTKFREVQDVYKTNIKISRNQTVATLCLDWHSKMKANQQGFEEIRSRISPDEKQEVPAHPELSKFIRVKELLDVTSEMWGDLADIQHEKKLVKVDNYITNAMLELKKLEKYFYMVINAKDPTDTYRAGEIVVDKLPAIITEYASNTLIPMAQARNFSVENVKDYASYDKFLLSAWDGIKDLNYKK